jgi:RNA polymerase sigma factor (sigma-70 family)
MRLELSPDLVKKAQNGDLSVRKQILVMTLPKISGVVARYVSDRDDRKDLVQDASLHILLNLHKYEPYKGDFGAWVYRLTSNLVLEWLRKNKKHQESVIYIEKFDSEATEEDIDIETLTPEMVIYFLETLPNGARKIFNLFYIEGYKHQEIARLLNISENTSKTQAFKAKNLFVAFLKQAQLNAEI